jgi:hypothetical protein
MQLTTYEFTIKIKEVVIEESNLSKENNDTKERFETRKGRLGKSFKKRGRSSNIMHDQYIRSAYRPLISEEDAFLWLLR